MRTIVNLTFQRLLLVTACTLLLAACASGSKGPANTLFDFGPAVPRQTPAAPSAIAAIVITDVTGTAAYDNERMFYRLNYADALQARAYANSRWSANPMQLLTQRLKSRVAQAGIKVLSETDASTGIPLLRVDIDDFTHNFDSVSQSYGQVVLRASLFQGHTLIDPRTFTSKTAARSNDAAGGARALADSTDTVAADMIGWLVTLKTQRQ